MKMFRSLNNKDKPFTRSIYSILIALLLTLATTAGCAQNLTSVQDCQLHILLTNDDGWDAPGIQVVRGALAKAGHRVTVVAPLNQQSGKGGALNTKFGAEVSVIEQSANVWSVDGTPTDSVHAGLNAILADDPPDLVVSGANFGPNVGQHAAHASGTIGAALAAHFLDVPAMALSTGLDVTERNTTPPFKSTIEGFKTTSAIAVGMIARLTAQSNCNENLPSDFAVSINVPVPADKIKGIRSAPLSKKSLFDFHWSKDAETGKIGPGVIMHDMKTDNPKDDVEYFASGYVSVTQINGDIAVQENRNTTILFRQLDSLLPASQ